jgi:ubiquinone/menaquinone biosynthesis C-methylase UbiE
MLQPKLKVAVDYQKCHSERCDRGVCAAVLECPTKLWRQEEPGHSILDLGSGIGRNDCFIALKIGPDGSILGLDISKEMLRLLGKRCQLYPDMKSEKQPGG